MKNISRIYRHPRKTKGKSYDRAYLYIPSKVLNNPLFFEFGTKVAIEYDDNNKRWYLKEVEFVKKQEIHEQNQEHIEIEEPENIQNEQKEGERAEITMLNEYKDRKINKIPMTSTIECCECHKSIVLINPSSKERKCIHCGFVNKREDFKFILTSTDEPKPEQEEKVEPLPAPAQENDEEYQEFKKVMDERQEQKKRGLV